jgi:hypothetical protein
MSCFYFTGVCVKRETRLNGRIDRPGNGDLAAWKPQSSTAKRMAPRRTASVKLAERGSIGPVWLAFLDGTAMAMTLEHAACNWPPKDKGEMGMKRTLTILSAAIFAGALSVPAVQAQEPAAPAPAAAATAAAPAAEAPAPAAEASPAMKKHHMRHHHHKKSSMKGESGATGATGGDTGTAPAPTTPPAGSN